MKNTQFKIELSDWIFTCVVESYDRKYVVEVESKSDDLDHDFYDMTAEDQDGLITDALDIALGEWEDLQESIA